MLSGIPSFLPHFLTISRVQYVSELIHNYATICAGSQYQTAVKGSIWRQFANNPPYYGARIILNKRG